MYISKKTALIIVGIIIVLLVAGKLFSTISSKSISYSLPDVTMEGAPAKSSAVTGEISQILPPINNPPTVPGQVEKRLIIRDANLSLVVKDLNGTKEKIISLSESAKGYLVSATVYGTEKNTSALVVIRVPETEFNQVLNQIRSLAVKITSESISGQDVTEEYVDLTGRLKSLEVSRNRFQEILKNASTVDQILTVQREIDRVQMDIEQTTGRMEYLSKSAAMSKITVNLALDEESLPYVPPSEKWKPASVFKQAVRSLLSVLKDLSYLVIWIAVFAVVWIPAIFLFKFLKKKFFNN